MGFDDKIVVFHTSFSKFFFFFLSTKKKVVARIDEMCKGVGRLILSSLLC